MEHGALFVVSETKGETFSKSHWPSNKFTTFSDDELDSADELTKLSDVDRVYNPYNGTFIFESC